MALADRKLTDLTEKLTVPNDGWIHFVDPSDISQSPSGSSFKAKKTAFMGLDATAAHNKGNYNATTNTPTLINGTGQIGDYYTVNVSGTQDFGSGDITFAVGDRLEYNGSIWFKAVNNNQGGGVLTTERTLLSSALTTQDLAGITAYINALNPVLVVAQNETVYFRVTDTGQVFMLLLHGDTFGFSEPTILSTDVLEIESTKDIFNTYNVNYRVGACTPIARGLTTFNFYGLDAALAGTGTLSVHTATTLSNILDVTSAASAGSKSELTASNMARIYSLDFKYYLEFMNNDAAFVSTARCFYGFNNNSGTLGNVDPSTQINCVGIGNDTGDTNLQLMHNDGSLTCTKIDLGVNFPANTSGADLYRVYISFNNYNGIIAVKTERYNSSNTLLFTSVNYITTNFPTASPFYPIFWRNNQATALAVKFAIRRFMLANR